MEDKRCSSGKSGDKWCSNCTVRFASQAAPHTCAGVLPSPAAIRTTTSEAMTEVPAWSIIGAESGEPSGESARPGHDA